MTDNMTLRPDKAAMSLSVDWVQYWWVPLCVLSVLAVSWWVYQRRFRSRPLQDAVPDVILSPREIALQALDRLAQDGLIAKGSVKTHYVRLAEILRRYLSDCFHVSLLDATSSEVLRVLERRLDAQQYAQLKTVLEDGDMVKFAKAELSIDAHATYLRQAVDLVERVGGSDAQV